VHALAVDRSTLIPRSANSSSTSTLSVAAHYNRLVIARHVRIRCATGGWILHSGLEEWTEGEESATVHHAIAATAFPFLKRIPPRRLLRLLATQEVATGTILLAPFISPAIAGAALTASSTGLLTRGGWVRSRHRGRRLSASSGATHG
jgi:hypothetical protein